MKKLLCGAIAWVLLIPANLYAAAKDCIYCTNIIKNAISDYEHTCYNEECWVAAFREEARNKLGYTDAIAEAMVNTYGLNWAQGIMDGEDQTSICEDYCSCSCSTTWTSASTGIERGPKYTCDMGDCVASGSQWRCKTGYYGNPTSDTSGCTKCPSSGGISDTSTAPGSTDITRCYIPSGNSETDTTGGFTYTANCFYKN